MHAVSNERRLLMLETLTQINQRKLNSRLLLTAVDAAGVPCTGNDIEFDLQWLQANGCVVLETLGPMLIATLTERGEQVAMGHLRIVGVQRPSAG